MILVNRLRRTAFPDMLPFDKRSRGANNMHTKRLLSALVLLAGLSLSSTYALAGEAGTLLLDAGMADASTPAATAAPATGSATPDELSTPEMTVEEAIEAVKTAISLLKEGSYPAGVAMLWLVLAWGFGRWVFPMIRGRMSNMVLLILGASLAFASVLAAGIASGLSIWISLAAAVTDSGLVAVILDAVQRRGSDVDVEG